MQAARFDVASGRLDVVEVPLPEPGRGEVRVRVRACGICLSDVHLVDGSLPTALPVVTPGHEASGVIDALGEGVLGWQAGERVVLAGGRLCGRCVACTGGRFEECRNFEIMGFAYDGAWAEFVVVPAYSLTRVPDSIPFEQAAILADAVATPFAALTERAAVKAGESIGLWGIGGLGVHAVQIARLVGASPIIAFDPLPEARQRALDRGADVALDPTEATANERVLELSGGAGLDVAVDLVGSAGVLSQAIACTGSGGRIVLVGINMDPGTIPSMALFSVLRQTLLGHLGYRKRHLDDLVALVATGRLDVSRSVSELLPLSAAPAGVERLAKKEGNPIRLVLTP
jgi:threonine dehydrogenase-like Zn-dependent dehydrogenase